MIFRHFEDEQGGGHSYLIASREQREAAIVNPTEGAIERYRETLDELGLRLVCTLRTERNTRCARAAVVLESTFGARRIAPSGAAGHADACDTVASGTVLTVGDLQVEAIPVPQGYAGSLAYRVSHYTFAGTSVLIDFQDANAQQSGEVQMPFEPERPTSAPCAPQARSQPIENFRLSRDGVCVERLILEDLHTSLAESRFTPKEARVVRTYIRSMEENGFAHPSASELASRLRDVDRTAVHVLVHNVRWKQIDLNRLPLVLAGQTSKWLRGLQTKPEFTPHEQEFLEVYLRLLGRDRRPPTGPEIARALGGDRSVQWVRKRAHTIRRKQREFKMPELVLSRKSATRPSRGAFAPRTPRTPRDGGHTDPRGELDMRYGA